MKSNKNRKRGNNEESYDVKKYQKLEQENKRKIHHQLTDDQKERYQFFSSSKFNPRIIQQKILKDINISKRGRLALTSISKIYVGELVEYAKQVMIDWGDDPNLPIQPKHLREAYRRYQNEIAKFNEPLEPGQRFKFK